MRLTSRAAVPLLRAMTAAVPAGLAVSLAPFTTYHLRGGPAVDVCGAASELRLTGGLCAGATRSAWHGGADPPVVVMLVLAGLLAAVAVRSPAMRWALTLASGTASALGAVLGAAAISNPPPGRFLVSVQGGGSLTTAVPDEYVVAGRGWGFWVALVLTWLVTAGALASAVAARARPPAPPRPGYPGGYPAPQWPGWMPSGPGLGPPPPTYPPPAPRSHPVAP